MKANTFITAVLLILLAFLFTGCDGAVIPEPDFSKLPGPPPPLPPADITWQARPRAGDTDEIIFIFSDDPGDIKAADITLTGNVTKGALLETEGNKFQRKLKVTNNAPGTDVNVTVDIPDYSIDVPDFPVPGTKQYVVPGAKPVTVFGTTSYFNVVSGGNPDAKGRVSSSWLDFTFSSDSAGLIPRDVGVVYPNDFTITSVDSGAAAKANTMRNNYDEGVNTRRLTIQGVYEGRIIIAFTRTKLSPAAVTDSDIALLETAPATFWCEIALDENGDPKGNLLIHMTRRIDTSDLQTSNIKIEPYTKGDGPMGVPGAMSLTSMGPIDDRWGRTFGTRVSKTGDVTVRWVEREPDDLNGGGPSFLPDIIDLDWVYGPFTVYK